MIRAGVSQENERSDTKDTIDIDLRYPDLALLVLRAYFFSSRVNFKTK